MLEERNVEGAIRAVGLNPALFRPMDAAISNAFEAAGNMTASSIPELTTPDGFRTVFRFNIRNPIAEAWLSDWAGTKITAIIEDQKIAIRETLVYSLERGMNPRAAALSIVGRVGSSGAREGGIIGLTSSQAQWVRNYLEELQSDNPERALSRMLRDRRFDSVVRRYADANEPIPADLIEDMVIKYENRALRYRAEAIARTEVMTALHEAQQQSIEQALEAGAIPPEALGFIWRTARDNRVRDIHDVMEGQQVAFGEMFVDGDGNQLEYPGDPNAPPETTINCRCWREPVVDFLAGVT